MQRQRVVVRRDRESGNWWFNDQVRRYDDGGVLLHVDDLPAIAAVDAQGLMRRAGERDETVVVSEGPIGYLHDEDQPASPVSFSLHEHRLSLDVGVLLEKFRDESEAGHIASLLTPLLKRHRLSLISLLPSEYDEVAPAWLWYIRFGCTVRGRFLGELFQAGRDVIALLAALDSGALTRPTAGDLVRGGQAHVLIGQPEGHWLDAKSQHYDLATDHGEISLAQAVTRFCNAEAGGLVVVGMSTKKVPGGEEIRALAPVPHDGRMLRRYQQVLEKRVFPPPDGLSIEAVPAVLPLAELPQSC